MSRQFSAVRHSLCQTAGASPARPGSALLPTAGAVTRTDAPKSPRTTCNSHPPVKDCSWDEDVHALRSPGPGRGICHLGQHSAERSAAGGVVPPPMPMPLRAKTCAFPANADHHPPIGTGFLALQSSWLPGQGNHTLTEVIFTMIWSRRHSRLRGNPTPGILFPSADGMTHSLLR